MDTGSVKKRKIKSTSIYIEEQSIKLKNTIEEQFEKAIISCCGDDKEFIRDLARDQKAFIKEFPYTNKK